MRRYYLHTRKGGIFYAELVTPSGVKLTARSTGTTSRDEALLVVAGWLKDGLPTGRQHKQKPLAMIADLAGIMSALNSSAAEQRSCCFPGEVAPRGAYPYFAAEPVRKQGVASVGMRSFDPNQKVIVEKRLDNEVPQCKLCGIEDCPLKSLMRGGTNPPHHQFSAASAKLDPQNQTIRGNPGVCTASAALSKWF